MVQSVDSVCTFNRHSVLHHLNLNGVGMVTTVYVDGDFLCDESSLKLKKGIANTF